MSSSRSQKGRKTSLRGRGPVEWVKRSSNGGPSHLGGLSGAPPMGTKSQCMTKRGTAAIRSLSGMVGLGAMRSLAAAKLS